MWFNACLVSRNVCFGESEAGCSCGGTPVLECEESEGVLHRTLVLSAWRGGKRRVRHHHIGWRNGGDCYGMLARWVSAKKPIHAPSLSVWCILWLAWVQCGQNVHFLLHFCLTPAFLNMKCSFSWVEVFSLGSEWVALHVKAAIAVSVKTHTGVLGWKNTYPKVQSTSSSDEKPSKFLQNVTLDK